MTDEEILERSAALGQEIVDKYFGLDHRLIGSTLIQVLTRFIFGFDQESQPRVLAGVFKTVIAMLTDCNKEFAKEMEEAGTKMQIMYPPETAEAIARDPGLAQEIAEMTSRIKTMIGEYEAGRIPSIMDALLALGGKQLSEEEVEEVMEKMNEARRPN